MDWDKMMTSERFWWDMRNLPDGSGIWVRDAGLIQGRGCFELHSRPQYFAPHIVISGQGAVETGWRRQELGPGDMFTLWPDVEILYAEHAEHPWSFYFLHVEGDKSRDFMTMLGFSSTCGYLHPHQPQVVEEVFLRIWKLSQCQSLHNQYEAISLLYRLPGAVQNLTEIKVKQGAQDLYERAVALIHSQLALGINVDMVCQILKTSRVSLTHAFKEKARISPGAYILQTRSKLVKDLLCDTPHSVATIARMVGFSSEKYLYRRFKKEEGLTPDQFRRTHALRC